MIGNKRSSFVRNPVVTWSGSTPKLSFAEQHLRSEWVEATIIAADWAAPDPFRDGAGIAVVDVRQLVGVGELHPIADREIGRAVLRLEPHIGALQLATRPPHLAQSGIRASTSRLV